MTHPPTLDRRKPGCLRSPRTFLTNSEKGPRGLVTAGGQDTPAGPLPTPPSSPCVSALQPGLQRPQYPGSWSSVDPSRQAASPRCCMGWVLGTRLDQSYSIHPGTSPSPTQLLAGERACLCERGPSTPGPPLLPNIFESGAHHAKAWLLKHFPRSLEPGVSGLCPPRPSHM